MTATLPTVINQAFASPVRADAFARSPLLPGGWRNWLVVSLAVHAALLLAVVTAPVRQDIPAQPEERDVVLIMEAPPAPAAAPAAPPAFASPPQAIAAPPPVPVPPPVVAPPALPSVVPPPLAVPAPPPPQVPQPTAPVAVPALHPPPVLPHNHRDLAPRLPPRMHSQVPARPPGTLAAPQPQPQPASAAPASAAAAVTLPARLVAGLPGNSKPDYPMLARRRGEEGVVTLRFSISADGETLAVAVLHSSGFADLDQAALAVARTYRFTPATSNGSPVAASADEPFEFTLQH